MVISFLATIIAVSVMLVSSAEALDKKQAIAAELEIPPPAKAIKPEKPEGTIVLRKAKKNKYKYTKNKKGKKILVKDAPDTDFEGENLDDIYKKERKYFEKGQGSASRKNKPSAVKGPLASIPAAVANALASNIAVAKAERLPAPPPPPEKTKPLTAEEYLNVESTIQESKPTETADSKKVATKLPAKKISSEKKPKNFKEIKKVEVRQELENEVQLATADQGVEETNAQRNPTSVKEQKADAKDLLARVEKKYVTHFIKIKVNSEVTQTLLDRTKTYSGELFLAPESRFKMEIKEPNKHMLLMNGKNIWVVDYPLDETQDKVQILHSNSAKNLKNQAFLDIFTGVGNLQKRFKIESSDKKDDEITYKLIPKKKDEQVERIELKLDSAAELISVLSFWDSLGNKTQLKFSQQEFEDTTPKEIFNFKPPKDASITNL